MGFDEPFHKPGEKLEDYTDVFDKDDQDTMLTNKAKKSIDKLVASSVIETISGAIQSERWYWNNTNTECCLVGSGVAFVKLSSLPKSEFEKYIMSVLGRERLVAIRD